MELNDIINEERRVVDVDKIEMPVPEQKEKKETGKETEEELQIEEIPVAQLANMAIGAYNIVSCAIYRRIEPGFDASLTDDETKALKMPVEQFLQQYNIKMTPTTALIIALVGINMVKVMQLKAYRAKIQFLETHPNLPKEQENKENQEQENQEYQEYQEQKYKENGK